MKVAKNSTATSGMPRQSSMKAIALMRSGTEPGQFVRIIAALDRLEPLYFAVCFLSALAVLVRALAEVRSITARRQLRWIAWGTALGATPFAVGYQLPSALGVEPSLPMELSVIPLSLIPLAYAPRE